MGYAIDIEEKDLILFLRPTDEELGPDQAEELRQVVRARAGTGIKGVIVNLSLVDYMSSIYLSALVEVLKDLRSRGVKFALAELSQKNIEIVTATHLDRALPMFDSSYEAYARFTQ